MDLETTAAAEYGNRARRLCLAAALGLLCRQGAAAGAGMQFLRLDTGPRQLGMGGAAAALGGDVNSAAYNPALLASLDSPELAFSSAKWLEGIHYHDGLYARPTPWGSLGARIGLVGYGEIPSYDAAGARTGGLAAQDLLLGLSFARRTALPQLSLGGALKLARESVGPVSATGYLADIGAAWSSAGPGRLERVGLGAAVRNLGRPVRFDRDEAAAPTEALAGVSGRLMEGRFSLAADGRFPLKGPPSAHLGAEFWSAEALALRGGLEFRRDGVGIRVGLGVRLKTFQVDYAFLPLGDLGFTHHIGLRVRFGGPADGAYREGMRLLRKGYSADAMRKFHDALNIDPNHEGASRGLRQSYEAVQRLRARAR